MNARRGPASRRGTAGIAVVLALVILQLILVVFVIAGARDQDLTVQRIDATRSFYAADSALNMGLREIMVGVDEDGDGGIGTVSNDGAGGNDPTFGVAQGYTTTSISGNQTTVTSFGRSAGARAKVSATVVTSGGSGPAGGRILVYGDGATSIPKARSWNGTSWGASSSTLDVGANPYWVLLKQCPARPEVACVTVDSANTVTAMIDSGSSWGNAVALSTTSGTHTERPASIAYEQSSGNAVVVYRAGAGATLYYRTWNGTSWSSQSSSALLGAGPPMWVKMVPKPGSNEIMCIVHDTSGDLTALVWNGSSFGHKLLLTSSAAQSLDCSDAAYESTSGRCVVGFAISGGPGSSQIWDGASWSPAAAIPSTDGNDKWVRMVSDPASNKIIAMTLDGQSNVNVTTWTSPTWSTVVQFTPAEANVDRRNYDIAFEPAGTRALAVYIKSANTPYYRTFDGTNWSVEQTGPTIAATGSVVQLAPGASGQEILVGICRRTDQALMFTRWDGTTLSSAQTLAAALSASSAEETFMFADCPAGVSAHQLDTWATVAPQ